ncbi:MAG: hypothetical protein Q9221_000358 [Calogaya cf. arnoldii]
MTTLSRKRKASVAYAKAQAKFQCSQMRSGTGRRCSRLFTRQYNRIRHEREQHKEPFTIFQYNPHGALVAISDPRPDAAVDTQDSQDQYPDQPSASASSSPSPRSSSSASPPASPPESPSAGPSTSAFTPVNPAPAEQHSPPPGLGSPAIDSALWLREPWNPQLQLQIRRAQPPSIPYQSGFRQYEPSDFIPLPLGIFDDDPVTPSTSGLLVDRRNLEQDTARLLQRRNQLLGSSSPFHGLLATTAAQYIPNTYPLRDCSPSSDTSTTRSSTPMADPLQQDWVLGQSTTSQSYTSTSAPIQGSLNTFPMQGYFPPMDTATMTRSSTPVDSFTPMGGLLQQMGLSTPRCQTPTSTPAQDSFNTFPMQDMFFPSDTARTVQSSTPTGGLLQHMGSSTPRSQGPTSAPAQDSLDTSPMQDYFPPLDTATMTRSSTPMGDMLQQDWEGLSTPLPSQVPMNAATQDLLDTYQNSYIPPSDVATTGISTPIAGLLQQDWPSAPSRSQTPTTADPMQYLFRDIATTPMEGLLHQDWAGSSKPSRSQTPATADLQHTINANPMFPPWDIATTSSPMPMNALFHQDFVGSSAPSRSQTPATADLQHTLNAHLTLLTNLHDAEGEEDNTASLNSESNNGGASALLRHRKNAYAKSRAAIALIKAPIPAYSIKLSKVIPDQERAVSWIMSTTRNKFREMFEILHSSWGVGPDHKGTCVMVTEATKAIDPVDIMRSFHKYATPTSNDDRATWGSGDHSTTIARAAVWLLTHWPRRGRELDNFIGCGDDQPMDASHRCHQDHCVVLAHLVYESAHINQDRNRCCSEARIMRQNDAEIPEHCSEHDPPCLLQHAVLTTFEAYSVQNDFLCMAIGEERPARLPKPRYYKYPTFETRLPTRFSAMKVDPSELVSERKSLKKEGKPDLICSLCASLKAYKGPINLWSHLIRKHGDDDTDKLVAEVIRTAALWDEYWTYHSEGGKKSLPNHAKVQQALSDEFTWQDVLDWDIR